MLQHFHCPRRPNLTHQLLAAGSLGAWRQQQWHGSCLGEKGKQQSSPPGPSSTRGHWLTRKQQGTRYQILQTQVQPRPPLGCQQSATETSIRWDGEMHRSLTEATFMPRSPSNPQLNLKGDVKGVIEPPITIISLVTL